MYYNIKSSVFSTGNFSQIDIKEMKLNVWLNEITTPIKCFGCKSCTNTNFIRYFYAYNNHQPIQYNKIPENKNWNKYYLFLAQIWVVFFIITVIMYSLSIWVAENIVIIMFERNVINGYNYWMYSVRWVSIHKFENWNDLIKHYWHNNFFLLNHCPITTSRRTN